MSLTEKSLYVKSLIGAENARARKGGEARTIAARPEEIVKTIDAAYVAGDQRSPDQIFSTLVQRPDSPPRRRPASP